MLSLLDEEVARVGSQARQRITGNFDVYLEIIERMASGLLREGEELAFVASDGTRTMEKYVYRVPPDWRALKWLADWGRAIVREGPKKEVVHSYPPELMEAVRQYLDERQQPPIVHEPGVDGVIKLIGSGSGSA